MFAPTTDQPIETIEKETIPNLQFAATDVLTDKDALERRRVDAERATRLGNTYQGKLDIFFQTADGQPKRVQTRLPYPKSRHYAAAASGAGLRLLLARTADLTDETDFADTPADAG
jgi:hypothetical protein